MDSISKLGYSKGSPYANSPFLDIFTPEGLIDMSNTEMDLMGIDNKGKKKRMKAGTKNPYRFEGNMVREIPMQVGGTKNVAESTGRNVIVPVKQLSTGPRQLPTYKDNKEQTALLKDISTNWFSSNGKIGDIDSVSYIALRKMLNETGNPTITMDESIKIPYYNSVTNNITLKNAHADVLLSELTHAYQQNVQNKPLLPLYIKDWLGSPFLSREGQLKLYDKKGTVEYDAHTDTKPVIDEKYSQYVRETRNKKNNNQPWFEEGGNIYAKGGFTKKDALDFLFEGDAEKVPTAPSSEEVYPEAQPQAPQEEGPDTDYEMALQIANQAAAEGQETNPYKPEYSNQLGQYGKQFQNIDTKVAEATKELLTQFPDLQLTSGRRDWGDKDAHPLGRAVDLSYNEGAYDYYKNVIVPKYGFNKALDPNHGTGKHIHLGYY